MRGPTQTIVSPRTARAAVFDEPVRRAGIHRRDSSVGPNVSDYRAPWALLPEGWKRDVRIAVTGDGTISAVEPESARDGATALAGPVLAGMPNAHSHVLQRALAGRAEGAGPQGDSFWSWRETMYAFTRRSNRTNSKRSRRARTSRCSKPASRASRSFTTYTTRASGRPYPRASEMAERVLAAAARRPGSRSRCCPFSTAMATSASNRRMRRSSASCSISSRSARCGTILRPRRADWPRSGSGSRRIRCAR